MRVVAARRQESHIDGWAVIVFVLDDIVVIIVIARIRLDRSNVCFLFLSLSFGANLAQDTRYINSFKQKSGQYETMNHIRNRRPIRGHKVDSRRVSWYTLEFQLFFLLALCGGRHFIVVDCIGNF